MVEEVTTVTEQETGIDFADAKAEVIDRNRKLIRQELNGLKDEVLVKSLGSVISAEKIRKLEKAYPDDPLVSVRNWQTQLLEDIVVLEGEWVLEYHHAQDIGLEDIPRHLQIQLKAREDALMSQLESCMKVYDNIVTGKTPSRLYQESRAISGDHNAESMYQHLLEKSPMLRETLERSQRRQEHYSHLYEPALRSQAQKNVKQIDMDMLPVVSRMTA